MTNINPQITSRHTLTRPAVSAQCSTFQIQDKQAMFCCTFRWLTQMCSRCRFYTRSHHEMIQVQLPHSLRGQMTLDPAVGSFLVQSLQQCSSSFCLLSTLSSGSAWCRHPNGKQAPLVCHQTRLDFVAAVFLPAGTSSFSCLLADETVNYSSLESSAFRSELFFLQKEKEDARERTSAGFCVKTGSCALRWFKCARGQTLLPGRDLSVELQTKIPLMDPLCLIYLFSPSRLKDSSVHNVKKGQWWVRRGCLLFGCCWPAPWR